MVLSFFIIQHERYFVILKKKNIRLYPHISSGIRRRCDVPRHRLYEHQKNQLPFPQHTVRDK